MNFCEKTILGSFSAQAAPTASLDYTCEIDGVSRTGTASIDDELILGQSSCMFFEKGPDQD